MYLRRGVVTAIRGTVSIVVGGIAGMSACSGDTSEDPTPQEMLEALCVKQGPNGCGEFDSEEGCRSQWEIERQMSDQRGCLAEQDAHIACLARNWTCDPATNTGCVHERRAREACWSGCRVAYDPAVGECELLCEGYSALCEEAGWVAYCQCTSGPQEGFRFEMVNCMDEDIRGYARLRCQ